MTKSRGGSSADRAPDASRQEVASSNLAPRSIYQAAAAGLKLDPPTVRLGADDGRAGMFRLTAGDILGRGDDIDVLAYLRGWLEAERAKRRS
jgi:hypothetical protein